MSSTLVGPGRDAEETRREREKRDEDAGKARRGRWYSETTTITTIDQISSIYMVILRFSIDFNFDSIELMEREESGIPDTRQKSTHWAEQEPLLS